MFENLYIFSKERAKKYKLQKNRTDNLVFMYTCLFHSSCAFCSLTAVLHSVFICIHPEKNASLLNPTLESKVNMRQQTVVIFPRQQKFALILSIWKNYLVLFWAKFNILLS